MRLTYNRYTLARGVENVKTKAGLAVMAFTLALGGSGGMAFVALNSASAATTTWSLNGAYTLDFELSGSHYVHDATVTGQYGSGAFAISGGYPAGAPAYADAWAGTGTVSGNVLTISADYTAGAPGTHMDMTGSVAPNGTLSGTWTDNYQGSRSGTWSSVKSSAKQVSQIVVTSTNTQGWSTDDTRPGGAVNFTTDSTAPGDPHNGALGLTTDATTTSKAQYMHAANVPLSNVSELSYSTKQISGPSFADASYQLPVCLGGILSGVCSGFTTFVYEPYQNGTVIPGVWQSWDVDAGHSWSTRSFTSGTCTLTAGGGGAPFYTLAALQTACPNAVVAGIGVNIGSDNPSYNVEADLVNFNGTTYNFEPYTVATDKDQCKDGGWQTLKAADGSSFKNQGACVSYVSSNGKSQH